MSAPARSAPRSRTSRAAGARRTNPLSWKKDPGGRRERVLVEATKLFSEKGFSSVSTGDIARAAGVAEGSVFHYFGSKSELLRAAGARYGVEFAAAMFDRIEPVASIETVERMVARAFEFVAGSWTGFGLFLLSDDPSAAPLAHKANRVAITGAVERMLDAWTAAGLLQDVDVPVVADLLFGLMEASLRACFTEANAPARVRYERETVRAISRILAIFDRG